ncbi:hypothetical protein KC19_4G187600 [Ceratodon purpureus]|uniref:Uncharacterized protein n=1 Tax=Ceratodon purpureus TaxID=3225 RepID=A0A8T0ICQ3_CERPU|nr:hypothetical protein KC19_4G187600 [Ceratodon purpureus]
MGIFRSGFVSVMFIFLMVSLFCYVEGRSRLSHDLHEGSGVGTRVLPSDHPFSDHEIDPGYNSGRKMFAQRSAVAEEFASSKNDAEGQESMDSAPAAASSTRKRLPFHTQFVSKFPFFNFAKDNSTVTPAPGTPSPGHN